MPTAAPEWALPLALLILVSSVASGRTIWQEVEETDYEWRIPESLASNKNVTDIACYTELGPSAIGHVFRLSTKKHTDYNCIIRLPSKVDIQFLQLDFETTDTTVQLLMGNNRSRLPRGSFKLSLGSSKDTYGDWTMGCLFGYMTVAHSNPRDAVMFKIKPMGVDSRISEELCTSPPRRRRRTLHRT